MICNSFFAPILKKFGPEFLFAGRAVAIGCATSYAIDSLLDKHEVTSEVKEEVLREIAHCNHLHVRNLAEFANMDADKVAELGRDTKSLFSGTLMKACANAA